MHSSPRRWPQGHSFRRQVLALSLVFTLAALLPAGPLFQLFPVAVAFANSTAQALPFTQDWSNTGLITTNDDWSGVPGVEGFFLRNDAVSTTAVDPQTLLDDSFGSGTTTVETDVIANQTSTGISNGGVAEFHTTSQPAPDGTNPTIALQGSGTADAPFILLHLDTTGKTGINVAYNLRDIDCTADNAVQAVALQFRVGNSGTYTNVAAGFVADATTGPSICTAVTAVSAPLPALADNQPLVQVRIITTNAAGNDEWVGVDDINITAGGGSTPTNPSGVGAANPSSVAVGGSTLLTVTVNPGTNPTSTGLAVTGDLTSIGGTATQTFFDDGTNGDVTAGDNVFSFNATVASGTTGGAKSLPITITDAQARSGSTSISLTVLAPTNPLGTGSANPSSVQPGGTTLLTVTVTPGTIPASTGLTVTADLTSIGGSASQQFFDNGTNGDVTAGDNIFSFSTTVSPGTAVGAKSLPVTITDAQSRTGNTSISLTVVTAPVVAGSVVISQVYGGGGNAGATLKNDFIELFNRSQSPVNVTGWSIQYASAGGGTGTTWTRKTTLTGTINPGQYFLVQQAAGSGGSVDLPTPDVVGTIAIGATEGKVALVSNDNFLPNGCPVGNPGVIDFVGYGNSTTDCFEGTPAPTLSNTTAALRARGGCKDTDSNGADFTAVAPSPRNSSSPANTCPLGDLSPEVFSTTPANGAVAVALNANVTITFDESVTAAPGAFTISCTASGAHTAAVTGGPTVFTLDPDTDFLSGEQCTVTVLASNVTDLDTDDPPDQMAANYSFTFTALTVHDPSEHLVMGNPSNAVTDVNFPHNYLMLKPQYVLSYHRDFGRPNWVSWHLDPTWLGTAPRQDDFRADDTLPADWYHVQGTDFSGSGFDRGHMTPSADRTSSIPDNSATFLMTNMVVQAPDNNQGPWEQLESASRTLVSQGSELYIISGPHGVGGTGSNGAATTIANGKVAVPELTWKVIMTLPNQGGDDVSRVTEATRTFAVIMPNIQGIRNDEWHKYLATVDQVEALTGYDFFSNVPESIQNVIESRLDAEFNTAPVATGQSVTVDGITPTTITLQATDFNVNNVLSYTVVAGPAHGTLSGTGPNLVYTADAGYSGPDSFTFKANDGGKESNVATVTITVNEGGTVQFSAAGYQAPESAASVTITVRRVGAGAGATSVNFATSGGTAQGGASCAVGVDYLTASGTLTWAGGDTSDKTFTVTLCDDTLAEDSETVNLTLTGVVGAASLGSPSSAVLTITDSDAAGGTFRFAEPTYSVQEGNPGLVVTVERIGNTSQASTVDYVTFDLTASSRSDYIAAFGTLSFAAGETSKTITVFANEDTYIEGTEAFSITLTNPTEGAIIGQPSATTVEVIDDVPESTGHPSDDPEAFVRQHYRDFLNRDPDPAGLAFWVGQITECETRPEAERQACREVRRINVSAAFFLSIEFQETGVLVYNLHDAAFDTDERLRFRGFLTDTQEVSRDVIIGQPGAEARLEANKQAFLERFVQRQAFLNRYPQGVSPADFIAALNTNVEGALTQAEADALAQELAGAGNTPQARAAVLRKVAENAEVKRRSRNRAFVLMQYFGYLRRNPDDAPDVDFSGYEFWLAKLNQFNGDFIAAEMVKAFITSKEYRGRFGQP